MTPSSNVRLAANPNHVSPDHFLNLEEADVVTKEQVASAWDLAYGELKGKLVAAGEQGAASCRCALLRALCAE